MNKTIEFKIIYNENENIHQEGYVEVPEDVEELPEWFYYDQQGFAVPREFTHHDEIGLTQIGATSEQEGELERFYQIVRNNEVDFINDVILTAEEDEHRTYIRNDITIIVNDGAKMECEIRKPQIGNWGDYMVEVIPRFNGERIKLGAFLLKNNLKFDPYGIDEDTSFVDEDTHKIYFEMSKDFFEDDEVESNMEFVNNEARTIFAQMLTLEAEIGEKYGDMLEQSLDDETDDDWLFRFSNAIENGSVDELIKDEGFEIP